MHIQDRWSLAALVAAALALGACSGDDGTDPGGGNTGGSDSSGGGGQGGSGQGGSGQGGSGQGGAGQGGAGQGGGSTVMCSQIPACSICAECTADGPCMTEYAACQQNPECIDLFTCHRDCLPSDTTCPDACDQTYPGGLAEFGAFRTCYESECSMACGG